MNTINRGVPTALTIERDCKLVLTTQNSKYIFLSQADNKLEIDIAILAESFTFQMTTSDLLKILIEADTKLSQSRILKSF